MSRRIFTEKQIIDIRQKHVNGISATILAENYGVTPSHISMILRGKRYKDCGGPVVISCNRPPRYNRKLSGAQVLKIRERYSKGNISVHKLAQKYGVTRSAINHVVQGKTYKDIGGPISTTYEHRNNRKLTDAQAQEIRIRYSEGNVSEKSLAREYGISIAGISRIILGRIYKDAGGSIGIPYEHYQCGSERRSGLRKLTDAQVREIRTRYSKGNISQNSLAYEYGVPQPTISHIIRGKTYKDVGG